MTRGGPRFVVYVGPPVIDDAARGIGGAGSDRAAIEHLIFTYAELLDAGDFESVAELFGDADWLAENGASAGALHGRDGVLEMLRSTVRLYDDGTPRTKHVTTNVRIEIDEDGTRASSTAYFTVLQATSGLPLQAIVAGRYLDTFAKREGAWRFVQRKFATDLVGDVSGHMLRPLPR